MVILREIEADGYDGGITILRDYVRPKRALRPGRATVCFETRPSQQLQSDWGEVRTEIAGVATKVHFIVNQLAYSRRFHPNTEKEQEMTEPTMALIEYLRKHDMLDGDFLREAVQLLM